MGLKQIYNEDNGGSEEDNGSKEDDDPNQSITNSVKLFDEWCRRSPLDPTYQGRFKLIPRSTNLDAIGVPSYLQKYDNKPMLIKRSGITGILTPASSNVLHFEINFYPFPYLAKQGFSYLLQNYFSKIDVSLAFLIEGRDINELPEVLIGAVRLAEPNVDLVVKEEDFFGEEN